jgi:hypothetical protein
MLVNNYIDNGYTFTSEIIKENEIRFLRSEINKEFLSNSVGGAVKKLIDFKNQLLIKKIINLYRHPEIQNFITQVEKKFNTKIALLPTFVVHKNYHVNLKEFHGWHRDCGGELKYDFCKNILSSKDYFFSKIAFYLQENEDYGGSIDIIKTSHKNFSKKKIIIRKVKNIPLRITMLFHKYFNKLYNLLPENFFMSFLNAKKLKPKLGTAVFFDSRIIHRGSPISKINLNKVKYQEGKYHAYLPDHVDKFSIYCQLGTEKGIDSYMYDRLSRKDNFDELKLWTKEIDFLTNFDKELFSQANSIIKPIKEKYQKYLK